MPTSSTVKISHFQKEPGVYRLRAEMPRLRGEPRKQITRVVRCSPHELKRHEAAFLLEMQQQANQQLHAAGLYIPVRQPPMTVQQFALRWLEQRRKLGSFSGNTLSQYRNLLISHVIPTWGHLELGQVTRREVLDGFATLAGNGLSPATLEHIRCRLAALLNEAEAEGVVVIKGVTAKLPLPKKDTSLRKVLTEAQTKRLLAALEGDTRLGPIMRLMLATGIRRGEACGLRWGDIDLEAGTMTISRVLAQIDNGPVVVKAPKTDGSRRVIALHKQGIAAARLMRATAEQVAEQLGHAVEDQPVFLSASGEAWRPSQLSQAITTLRQRLNLPELTAHKLRHAHATSLLRMRHNVRAVAKRLGHKDPAMTLRIYAHVMGDDDAVLAQAAGDAMAKLQTSEDPRRV